MHLFNWNVSHVNRKNEDDGYCAIEDRPVSQTPAPAPPSRTQPTRQRPPEPLPQLPKRPHSVSCPDPSIDFTTPRNPLPVPPRRGSSDVPEHPVPQKKPLTLPRPTTPGPKQTRPLTMGRLPRSSTESSLTTQPRGYDNVVNQLANVNLSSADKKGNSFPDQHLKEIKVCCHQIIAKFNFWSWEYYRLMSAS